MNKKGWLARERRASLQEKEGVVGKNNNSQFL
jgi:hypothetical protein